MKLQDKIAKTIEYRDAYLRRMADAGDIVDEHVIPHLPATIDRFDAVDVAGTCPLNAEDQGRATGVTISFRPTGLGNDADVAIAYGTIVKTIRALQGAGWELEPRPELTAHSWVEGMVIAIKGRRTISDQPRWYRKAGIIPWKAVAGERAVQLRLVFDSMPETDMCRIEESVERVPASTRTVRRVVCDGDGPAGLLQSSPLSHGVKEMVQS